ncbi:hypothetical protein C0995_005613 [Termitomyces sp. Mi166|nr:hypothetical protein C0995_005613 [Termitomyces sp. Mi166\
MKRESESHMLLACDQSHHIERTGSSSISSDIPPSPSTVPGSGPSTGSKLHSPIIVNHNINIYAKGKVKINADGNADRDEDGEHDSEMEVGVFSKSLCTS